MSAPWPLVGRKEELEQASRTLSSPASHGLVIAGPAGVGKTRLARECLELAADHGFATARVLASESAATIPLGALSPLLPPLGEDRHPAELLRRARTAIAGGHDGARLALLVDDAHRLDEMSATLVAQLATEAEAFVIVTVRSEEPAPDAILDLWKDGILERIDLRPLGRAAVEELLRIVLEGNIDGGTVRRFAEASGGNPLYLRELVLAARESALLVREDRMWRLTGSLPVSSRLVEIIGARLAKIDPVEREALEVIAFGEPIGIGLLEEEFGVAVLDRLQRLGLVHGARDGRRIQVTLAHPLYGEVLRARLPVATAREIHRRLAALLSHTGARRRDDALRLGTCLLEAGATVDAEVLLRAAHAARDRWDLPLAQRLADAASGAGAGFPAGLLLAQLQLLQGRPLEAERALSSLVHAARSDADRVALATTRIDNFAMGLADRDQALRVAAETEAVVTDVNARHELAGKRGELLYLAGGPEPALEVLQPLLREGNCRTVALAAPVAGMCLMLQGRFTEAIEVADRGYGAYLAHRGLPLTFGSHTLRVVRGVALAHAGRLDEALALGQAGYEKAITDESVEARAMFAELQTWGALLAGRPATAQQFAAEAAGLYRELGWAPFLRFALAHLAHAAALLRRPQDAEKAVAELDELAIPDTDVAGSLVLHSRAWVRIAAGDVDGGRELLARAAEVGASTGDRADEVAALHDLARVGHAPMVVKRLRELATVVEGELVQVRAAYATALDALDGEGLKAASARFVRLGMNLFAAEAAAGAAVVFRRAGQMRTASATERQAAALLGACEGAVTPAVADIEAQAMLTPQELKVAGLAAAGMSNKEIATQLRVSVRTVETQLQRVYEKLGVHRRSELSDALVL